VFVEDAAQPRRDLVDGLSGGDRCLAAWAVALRGEEPVGRVVELAEAAALDARETVRQRVIGITGDAYGLPVFDVDEQAAQRRTDTAVGDELRQAIGGMNGGTPESRLAKSVSRPLSRASSVQIWSDVIWVAGVQPCTICATPPAIFSTCPLIPAARGDANQTAPAAGLSGESIGFCASSSP
jgi:hypothetical protein